MTKSSEKKMWTSLLKFSKKYVPWIILIIITTLINIYANIYASELLKNVINITLDRRYEEVTLFIIMGLAVLILGTVSKYLVRYATDRYGSYLMRDIRSATIDYLGKLPPDYTMKNNRGEILAKLSGDANTVQNFMSGDFINLIYLPIMVLCFGIYLAHLNFVLFLASFIIQPILIPLNFKIVSPIKISQRAYAKYLGQTNNNIQNAIDGISVIKAYNLEDEMSRRYDESIMHATNTAFINDKREHKANPIVSVTRTVPGIICIILGGYMCLDGKMTTGELMAFINIFAMFTRPMAGLFMMIINMKVVMASAERLFSILDEPCEKSGDIKLTRKDYEESDVVVQFDEVDFSYDKDNLLLDKLNLVVPKGKSFALVGSSGSGKTTILRLICKIYEADGGSIKICGKDIKDIDVETLRENISYVSQTAFLFPFSVKENILVGNPKASMEEVIEAAKQANAHEFIKALPEGYETLVGERGAKLSGGQIQRISIARAVLKNSPIILLDEATSALDNQSEVLVKEALDNLKKDKTMITVAHRLSTIEDADEILVLNDGAILEQGTHLELIDKKSAYFNLLLLGQKERIAE